MFFKSRSSKKKLPKINNQKSLRFLREPLIHFFVLGLAVFGLHAVLDRKPVTIVDDPYLVEVSSADIEWMWTLLNKKMGREPTRQDLRDQVNQLIREQILSREAVAMGLDEGDIVVRRRLVQKVEFLFKDLSAVTEPTEDDLRKYYAKNRTKYEMPPQVTFSQVYFSIDSRGVDGAKQAAQALTKEGHDPSKASTLGDASMLSPECVQCSTREIINRLGTDFVKAVENLEPGSWYGPIRSTYGFHAVYIFARQEAILPKLENIIDRVRNDWMFENQEENKRRVYKEIRSRYRVLLEGLPYDLDVKG